MRTLDEVMQELFTPEEIAAIEQSAQIRVVKLQNGWVDYKLIQAFSKPYGARKKHRRKMKKRNR